MAESAPAVPEWETLGGASPSGLTDPRLELHHAVQLVSAVGATLLEPRPDDSHPNLGWDAEARAFVGRTVPRPGFRAALRVADLALYLERADGTLVARTALGGRTLVEAGDWLASEIRGIGAELPSAGLTLPAYDLPPHPVAEGEPLTRPVGAEAAALEELARWYGNAWRALEGLAAARSDASEVRCWPHHFDLATLLTLETGPDGAGTKTVGMGMTPGDGSYPEPYWYVSPWPYPEVPPGELPALAGGAQWHTEGFTAAVLTASKLASGPPEVQAERLQHFLAEAVAASESLLAR